MAAFPIVPPGLQELIPVSQFYINQKWNSMFQYSCTYDLLGPNGNLVYQATENRECCGPRMDVRVQDTQGYNVLHLLIPYECCSWETKLQVIDASGQLLGYIEQNWSFSSASFDILNPLNQICLKVKGPGWGEGFMSDRVFQVLSADKSFMVGHITRVWKGISKEMFSREDKFVVQFPPDLEVSMKAILLSCTLLIDLLEHERQRNERNSS
ncbi:phospholipid scramblase 2-like [Hyla sarda]|uniref:phospholipid scramblase 2-like n=1 Tax=Hyla sarda TaxID=327740 RepID=UPI0024C26D24|nr:phospholipid scramblase 2-like [Hyla sarda]